jgi:hypothetical protein
MGGPICNNYHVEILFLLLLVRVLRGICKDGASQVQHIPGEDYAATASEIECG